MCDYYTVGVRGQKPSGKLYDSYCAYRKKLGNCGIITRRQRSTTAPSENFIVVNSEGMPNIFL